MIAMFFIYCITIIYSRIWTGNSLFELQHIGYLRDCLKFKVNVQAGDAQLYYDEQFSFD
jgi:hypothetical protein